jgi:DNA invertase Pin-like site-specific DNA recombinase
MNIGFLRHPSTDELRDEMDALEKAGCERIVVDNAPFANLQSGMLGTVIGWLSSGDTLVVWSLDSVANSMPELIDLALQLESRNVRLRSLQDDFDTRGRNRAVVKSTLQQLQEFQRQSELRHKSVAAAARRVGRPRALTPEKLERAQQLLAEGRNMDEVAKEFQVSRATLYRYLLEGRG